MRSTKVFDRFLLKHIVYIRFLQVCLFLFDYEKLIVCYIWNRKENIHYRLCTRVVLNTDKIRVRRAKSSVRVRFRVRGHIYKIVGTIII